MGGGAAVENPVTGTGLVEGHRAERLSQGLRCPGSPSRRSGKQWCAWTWWSSWKARWRCASQHGVRWRSVGARQGVAEATRCGIRPHLNGPGPGVVEGRPLLAARKAGAAEGALIAPAAATTATVGTRISARKAAGGWSRGREARGSSTGCGRRLARSSGEESSRSSRWWRHV